MSGTCFYIYKWVDCCMSNISASCSLVTKISVDTSPGFLPSVMVIRGLISGVVMPASSLKSAGSSATDENTHVTIHVKVIL